MTGLAIVRLKETPDLLSWDSFWRKKNKQEVSLWQYRRGKFQRQEEIRGAAPYGSSACPVLWLARNVVHCICRTEHAKLAALITDVKLFPRLRANNISAEKAAEFPPPFYT